jgi:transcriptional regulator with XRE-family HTH domain
MSNISNSQNIPLYNPKASNNNDHIYDFGVILQSLRKKHGLTQEQLATKINKESSIISRYENNLQSPTFDTVRALASIFNVSMDYLSGTEKRNSLSTYGLNNTQIRLLEELVDFFKEKNLELKSNDDIAYNLIGRLVTIIL